MRFLREQPRVADVAIKGRLKIQEQEPDFVDLSAETLAGQSMRKFMGGGDRQHGHPGEQQRIEPV